MVSDRIKADEPTDDTRPRGLGLKERMAATLVGLAGVGTGGVGVFISDNQAGTTAILLLGSVFLLMGVQGTAITKAGKDSVELERRLAGRRVLEQAIERAENEEPTQAADLVVVAEAIDPALRNDPAVRQLSNSLYEREVFDAINRVLDDFSRNPPLNEGASISAQFNAERQGRRADVLLTIYRSDGSSEDVAVEIKHVDSGRMGLTQLMNAARQIRHFSNRGLIISNASVANTRTAAQLTIFDGMEVESIRWRSHSEDDLLKESLIDLVKNQ